MFITGWGLVHGGVREVVVCISMLVKALLTHKLAWKAIVAISIERETPEPHIFGKLM